MRRWLYSLLMVLIAGPVLAKMVTRTVEYKDGNQVLEGFLAYDDAIKGKRPGVLVVHEWNGLGHYAQFRARQMARLGYVGFAADIYGKGVRPDTMDACKAESGKFYADRKLLRERVNAGLSQLEQNPMVDTQKIVAIGYCFGGTTVLELGRSGAPIAGIVSFHGGLGNPVPADDKNIKAKVLVCQGGADQFTLPDVPAFKKSMDDAKVDYQFITCPGAVHGFTNPDNKGTVPGIKYDANADRISWQAMQEFFKKVFNS